MFEVVERVQVVLMSKGEVESPKSRTPYHVNETLCGHGLLAQFARIHFKRGCTGVMLLCLMYCLQGRQNPAWPLALAAWYGCSSPSTDNRVTFSSQYLCSESPRSVCMSSNGVLDLWYSRMCSEGADGSAGPGHNNKAGADIKKVS